MLLWFKTPPGQDRGAKTRPQGQLECANPRGSPEGGDGQYWNWLIHKILVRILSFSNTRLQQQAMVGITQYSFEFFLFVIQDFSSRLWLGLLMAIYPTNSFAFKWCMNTSWLSKAMFTLYRIVKRSVTETEQYVQCEQATSAPLRCKIGIKIERAK